MKVSSIFILMMTVFTLAACQKPPVAKQTVPTEVETDDDMPEEALELNNGTKWKADKSTNQHAAVLKEMAKNFTALASPDVQEGKTFAAQVEKETAALVSACTMTGDDHEKLHIWLSGVLHDVDNVKQATDAESVETAATRLASSILSYNQYFE